MLNLTGSSKTYMIVVDGCHDRISLWVTRFGHLHSTAKMSIFRTLRICYLIEVF
jgi:hypothetical protein